VPIFKTFTVAEFNDVFHKTGPGKKSYPASSLIH
jgi:hypothetical protein